MLIARIDGPGGQTKVNKREPAGETHATLCLLFTNNSDGLVHQFQHGERVTT